MASKRYACCAATALLLSCAAARRSFGEAHEPRIPPEWAEAARQNQAAVERMRSCTATVEESYTQHLPAGVLSYKVSYGYWVKGRKMREHVVIEPGPPGTQMSVLQFRTATSAMYAGPPGPGCSVRTPQACIGYVPDSNLVNIIRGRPELPYGSLGTVLHWYAWGGGSPLQEVMKARARIGATQSLRQVELDGLACLLFSSARGHDQIRIWVVPSQGHMVCKRQRTYLTGELLEEFTAPLTEYAPGVFWFERAEETRYSKRGFPSIRRILVVKELKPNVELHDSLFTLEGLGVPAGTTVKDWVLDRKWRYGGMPELPPDAIE